MADRKISDLTALTAPASGDYLPIVDISEAAAASKNKRITIEELFRGTPDGTFGAPAISPESDPNTGIYFPAADQLAISTNGTGRLFVDASGNVTLGSATNYGARRLSVNGIVSLQDGSAEKSYYYWDGTTTQIATVGNNPTTFWNNSQERLRITGDGKVGLGTSSPGQLITAQSSAAGTAPTLKLQNPVDSNSSQGAANNLSAGELLFGATGAFPLTAKIESVYDSDASFGRSASLRFSGTNGSGTLSEWMRIASSGRVGIGTTGPLEKLHVSGGPVLVDGFLSAVRTSAACLDFFSGNTRIISMGADASTKGGIIFYNSTSTTVSEAGRFDTSGRLLVGTANSADNTRLGSRLSVVNAGATNANQSGVSIIGYQGASDVANAPFLELGRSRGTTDGSYTEVASGDALGYLIFKGADGVGWSDAVWIKGEADGDWTTSGDTTDSPGRLVFSTTPDGSSSPQERVRIDRDGRTWINTTSQVFNGFGLHVVYSGGTCAFKETSTVAGNNLQVNWHTATSGDNRFIEFGTEGTYTLRGSITYNRGGGLVAYNTTSDYRAKTLLGDVEHPGQTIDALRVYRGVMNEATVERPMLVAHEAQEVAPYCVTGEKDAVDEDGNPIYQQMDHQALVPLLIAEIQQLRARVAALEAS